MMFLSGIFLPMENARAWIRPVAKALALTYRADAQRDVIIKGEWSWFVRRDIVVLCVNSAVSLGSCVPLFRWE